jgi:adenine-specific DNA-methyltransferase
MIKVFGGEPVAHSPLLHGRKGGSWVHVGPLDGPVSETQVWSIAREAHRTNTRAVTILSADFDTLSSSEKDSIKEATGVSVTVRVIPSAALDEVRRRIEIQDRGVDSPIESMAVPAFYAPLSIVLAPEVNGRTVRLHLSRCEVDIESFLVSQRPTDVRPLTDSMTPTQKRKAHDAAKKWDARKEELEKWLARADSWQKFVDFWASIGTTGAASTRMTSRSSKPTGKASASGDPRAKPSHYSLSPSSSTRNPANIGSRPA